MFHGILEFTYISRPGITQHQPLRVLIQSRHAADTIVFLNKVSGQKQNILAAFTQGRHRGRDDVEPEEKVLAEGSILDHLLEIPVGGGDHPHIGPDRLCTFYPLELLILENPEQGGLRGDRQLADFIKDLKSR